MRLVHFAVLRDHLHLIVEAEDTRSLSRGMQGLTIRVAKATNHGERSGKVFRDRYHAAALESPGRVRNAIAYVLLNARRHAAKGGPLGAASIDPCSSGYWFDGWSRDVEKLRALARKELDFTDPPVVKPSVWLLRVGWHRASLIDPSEIPGTG